MKGGAFLDWPSNCHFVNDYSIELLGWESGRWDEKKPEIVSKAGMTLGVVCMINNHRVRARESFCTDTFEIAVTD